MIVRIWEKFVREWAMPLFMVGLVCLLSAPFFVSKSIEEDIQKSQLNGFEESLAAMDMLSNLYNSCGNSKECIEDAKAYSDHLKQIENFNRSTVVTDNKVITKVTLAAEPDRLCEDRTWGSDVYSSARNNALPENFEFIVQLKEGVPARINFNKSTASDFNDFFQKVCNDAKANFDEFMMMDTFTF